MTLQDLLVSPDLIMKIRGTCLRVEELRVLLNNQHKSLADVLGDTPFEPIKKIVFDTSSIYEVLQTGKIYLAVELSKKGPKLGVTDIKESLGPTVKQVRTAGPYHKKWGLSVYEWPMLTVELVANALTYQRDRNDSDTPHLLGNYLPLFFPTTSYAELLDWYRSDMLTLEKGDTRLPCLRDVMLNQALLTATVKPALPAGTEWL